VQQLTLALEAAKEQEKLQKEMEFRAALYERVQLAFPSQPPGFQKTAEFFKQFSFMLEQEATRLGTPERASEAGEYYQWMCQNIVRNASVGPTTPPPVPGVPQQTVESERARIEREKAEMQASLSKQWAEQQEQQQAVQQEEQRKKLVEERAVSYQRQRLLEDTRASLGQLAATPENRQFKQEIGAQIDATFGPALPPQLRTNECDRGLPEDLSADDRRVLSASIEELRAVHAAAATAPPAANPASHTVDVDAMISEDPPAPRSPRQGPPPYGHVPTTAEQAQEMARLTRENPAGCTFTFPPLSHSPCCVFLSPSIMLGRAHLSVTM
jgi:hypothetical protein